MIAPVTDRDLLNQAAKAAGAKRTDYSDQTPDHWVALREGVWHEWRPLTDDGDALRLAVKLGLWVKPNRAQGTQVSTMANAEGRTTCIEFIEDHGDPYVATRRAIVRAAATIGASNG